MKVLETLKIVAFGAAGAVAGAMTGRAAFGSVPSGLTPGHVTNDTAIYQNLSEIQVRKREELSFDRDLDRLAALEREYREDLPLLSKRARIEAPAKRIEKRKYPR